ncbi:KIF-1 binding protein,Tetratricopeptide-like helical domain [Cinara cedri]|uniref:KIF-binding protein n=1 Tax=Cinara cedri TaxID=506608 RepID=A0A5E4N437_9HEMI|nr:KIF-1 binding protein,Tetratricopeptide-like helical domain [Cinara cedri]
MVYSLKCFPPGTDHKMIVSSPLLPYPKIIKKTPERDYLSRMVPPTYEFHKRAKYDLENTFHMLVMEADIRTGVAHKNACSRLGAVCYQLGHVLYEIENGLGVSVLAFEKALEAIEDHVIDPDNVLTAINSLNMLAFLEANHNKNTERALEFLDRADSIYKTYRDKEPKMPDPTGVDVLLEDCTEDNRTWEERSYKRNPMVNARLYTLFYYIEIYRILKLTEEEIFYSHAALKHQIDNDIYMQCPLDWVQTCIQMSEWLLNANAFQQAKHHMEAASMFLEEVIPKNLSYYNGSQELKQYLADVSYSWSRYGMRLLKKSKTRLMKKKTHRLPPSSFNDLLFDKFEEKLGGQDTPVYVDNFKDAEELTKNIIKWINETKLFYTFDMSNNFYGYLSIDKCQAYKNLAFFQDNSLETEKLLKIGVVDMEILVVKLDDLSLRRQMWYELSNMYRFMMEIQYEQYVLIKKEVPKTGAKLINKYSNTSISYYLKFIESFTTTIGPSEVQKKAILLSNLYLAKCYDKQIVYLKQVKIRNLLEGEKYYKRIINYCESDYALAAMIPYELSYARNMLKLLPTKIKNLSKLSKTSKCYV